MPALIEGLMFIAIAALFLAAVLGGWRNLNIEGRHEILVDLMGSLNLVGQKVRMRM
jgi:hypothetical protein